MSEIVGFAYSATRKAMKLPREALWRKTIESGTHSFAFQREVIAALLRHSCEAKEGRGMQGKYSLYWDPVRWKWKGQESHYAIFSSKQLSARLGKAWHSAACCRDWWSGHQGEFFLWELGLWQNILMYLIGSASGFSHTLSRIRAGSA